MTKSARNRLGFGVGAVLAMAALIPMLQSSAAQAIDRKAERTWKANCASCHGNDGKAQTEKGQKMKLRDMTSADFQKLSDDKMRDGILNGVDRTEGGVKQQMDPFKDKLSSEQVDSLVKLIREFGK